MGTLAVFQVLYTAALYLTFLMMYGAEVFDVDDLGANQDCGFLEFFCDVVDFGGALAEFFTLNCSECDPTFPDALRVILLFILVAGWIVVGVRGVS